MARGYECATEGYDKLIHVILTKEDLVSLLESTIVEVKVKVFGDYEIIVKLRKEFVATKGE